MASDGITYSLRRHRLADGQKTTIYIVRHPLARARPRVHVFAQPRRLDHWCHNHHHREAVVGGFYLRNPHRPLGDVRVAGQPRPGTPFPAPYADRRPALHVTDTAIRIARRGELPADPAGDLLQAGPLLVADGTPVFDPTVDFEGFRAAAGQFDSDITDGRHPRAAVGISDTHLHLVVCDGRRSGVDAGLTLDELAAFMTGLGCRDAMNLDGGGSATLVHRGHLLNRPYTQQDQPAPESRPIVTALILDRR